MAEITGVTTVQAEVPQQSVEVQQHAPQQSIAPNTTLQQDLTTAGQRKVNLIWEYTQALIAITVVLTTMTTGIMSMINTVQAIPTIISVAFGMITGFYFSRTNHAAIGGIGEKPNEEYKGR